MPLDGTRHWTDREVEASIQSAAMGMLPNDVALALALEVRRLRGLLKRAHEAIGRDSNWVATELLAEIADALKEAP